jgi:hypothetical protein
MYSSLRPSKSKWAQWQDEFQIADETTPSLGSKE